MFFLVRRFTDLYPPDTWKRKDRNNRGDKKNRPLGLCRYTFCERIADVHHLAPIIP
jgi:hypothetical protein